MIQRYSMFKQGISGHFEEDDGEWVKYEDHMNEMIREVKKLGIKTQEILEKHFGRATLQSIHKSEELKDLKK